MSRVAYIRAWPRDPATGAAGLVAMAAGGSHLPYYLDGIHYRAGGVREPRFAAALGFDEKGWTGAALPTVSTIEFAPADPALLRAYAALYWKGAAIEVDAGEEYAGVGRILTGAVADASVRDNRLQITIADFGVQLARPAIQAWFAGTGGIEGDSVCEGRVKRRNYGRCANVEGRVLLAAQNIYEFGDPARPLQSIPTVRDMGREGPITVLAWQGSVAATLNALIAATPPQGGATAAPSIACVKWWTQPVGPLTADIQGENAGGYVETPAQIAARLLSVAGGPAIVNLAGAVALRNMVAGLHIGDDSETTAAALDRLLLPVSLLWRFGTTGLIDIRPWSWDGDAEAIQGRFIGRIKTLPPTRTRRLGYDRNHRQHSDGEIAADILAAGVSYADGTTLEQLKPAEAGSNKTETRTSAAFAGQGALATRSDVIYGSHITSLPAAISPSNLISGQYLSAGFGRYLDGITLQALRPGETGANVTESRVAASIAGQGTLATISSLGFGSPLLTGFGSLAGLGSLFFGSPYLLEGAGGAQATLSAFKTALGIASGFSGQGALATMSALANGSQFLTGFGGLSSLSNLFFGGSNLLETSGGAVATLANFKTMLGTASAITGQGFGATAAQTLVDNRQIALGQNSAVNSRFARGLYGWQGVSGTVNGTFYPITRGVNLNASWSGVRDVFYAKMETGSANWDDTGDNYADVLVTPGPWGGGTIADMKKFALPVKKGDRVACAAMVARHRCNARVYAIVLDINGTHVQAPFWAGGRSIGGQNGDPANMDRVGDCFDVTADAAAYCVFVARMLPSGQSQPYIFVTEVMLAKVQAGQAQLPVYSDGPADPVADQTSVNTASAITGQGALATLSALANGSSYLTGFGGLSSLSSLFFGSGNLLESNGGPVATLVNFKTSSGIASGIAGQGNFATLSALSLDSQLSGILANRLTPYSGDANYLSASRMAWAEGSTVQSLKPGEAGANVTEGRTAAAFSGQGALATRSSVAYGSSFLTGFGSLAATDRVRLGVSGGMVNEANNAWLTDGSVITALGTASAIAGQGFGATASQALVDNRQIALGQNSAVNSRFARGLYGWLGLNGTTNGASYTVTKGVNLNATYGGKRDVFYARVNTGSGVAWTNVGNNYADVLVTPSTWGGGSTADMKKFALPVKEGDRVACAALVARHRCNAQVYALVLDETGGLVNAPNWSGGRQGGATNGGDPALMDRVGDCFDVTGAAARYCLFMVRMLPTGEADPYVFVTEIMLAKVPAAQAQLPVYSDGPADPVADQTSVNTSSAFAGQGAFATQSYLNLDNSSYFQQPPRFYASEHGGQYFAASAVAFTSASGGNTLQGLRPGEYGANVTEGRTAAAFAGQGQLATRNSLGWTDALFTGRPQYLTDVVDRPGFPGEKSLRSDYVIQQGSGVALVSRWPQEAGANVTEGRTAAAFAGQSAWATYSGLSTLTVEQRTQRLQSDGYIESSTIYKSGSGFLSSFWAAEGGANVTEGRTAAGIAGQGAFATKSQIGMYEVNSFLQYGAIRYNYSITRSDGSTVVTEAMSITSLGIAAGFSGQGVGATANSLADLDPDQNAKLDGLVTVGRRAYGYSSPARIVLHSGATAYFEAAVRVNAGGNNGTIAGRIDVSLAGANSWTTIATGDTDSVGPTEAGFGTVECAFTNNQGTTKAFDVRVEVTRVGGGAGGAIDVTETYLLA